MGKTDILDEIRADQGKPVNCGLCTWLATQPREDAVQWHAAALDRTITKTSVLRAVKRRMERAGKPMPFGESSIDGHRKNMHSLPETTS